MEDGTYLGSNVTILHATKIGSNTIIGASSLVNKSIKENVIAFGIPCREKK
ncbi:MAG: acyltransferase [Candidatus Neomarinimicrobiota bacterium]